MEKQGLSPLDPSSFSRPELVITTDIFINLNVNFDTKVLNGNVNLTVRKIDENVNEIILDTLKLNISSIYDVDTKENLEYNLSNPIGEYGSKLTVQLPQKDGNLFRIGIHYETSPDASGLQWLQPNANAGKKHPYLFSQFQPTHARSVLPCQDTPGVKTTYTATIFAQQKYTVLMSALRNEILDQVLHNGKLSHFTQNVPVPSYLIAIVVGVLESRKVGPRSHVWAEKEIIDECVYEFANTETILKIAEDICGPYVWGIYDLLVLPPSFPYGGMEHACLTFVTPTLLAGDRSLVDCIAHEIAHSWTGNLITTRNYEHYWLNEGFTVFIERKIMGRLESPQCQDFDAYNNISEITESINRLGKNSPLTKLVVDLKGVHPDDGAFSTIPYEKGQTFLRYLENVVGGPEQFEPFLKKYLDTFKYKSIDTGDFKTFFITYFNKTDAIKKIDWDTWLYSTGMPPIIPDYDTSLAKICDNLVEKFLNWNDVSSVIPISHEEKEKLFNSQIIYILQKILEAEPQFVQKLQALNLLFGLDVVKNAEIKCRWLRICLKARWEDKVEAVFNWINSIGRVKYVRPLYIDLYNWEATKPKIIANFKANRQNMTYMLIHAIEQNLHM